MSERHKRDGSSWLMTQVLKNPCLEYAARELQRQWQNPECSGLTVGSMMNGENEKWH